MTTTQLSDAFVATYDRQRCQHCGSRRSDIGINHAKDCHVRVLQTDQRNLVSLRHERSICPSDIRPQVEREIAAHTRRIAWLMKQEGMTR